jgi:Spy/CpxP family protein refolding chaperone
MSHKTRIAFALAGALAFLAEPAIAQDASSLHQGPWPIQNGIKRQPTQYGLKALHEQDITPDQAREIDRLYDELMMSTYQNNHHTGIARSR